MVTTHTQSGLASAIQVGRIVGVYQRRTFRGFDIDIADATFCTDAIPINVALIAAHIDTFAIASIDLPGGRAHKKYAGNAALRVIFCARGQFIGHNIRRARFIGGIHLGLRA